MARIRVGINGYGTIGKRIADVVSKHPLMELVGVVKKSPDYQALVASRLGHDLYVADAAKAEGFEKLGVKIVGTLEDLLSKVDVIVDATPGGVGAGYKKLYESAGVKAIFQGGEKADVAEVSFSSLCNYRKALGKNSVRVVSCNTTGLLRLICTLDREFGVERVRAVMIRRAADPKEVKKGPINSINLNPPSLPSHHALDVKSVAPHINIWTAAVVVPTTLMHVHSVYLRLRRPATREDVLDALEAVRRILLVDAKATGVKATAQLIEAARDLRPRNDIPELVIFRDSVHVEGDEVMLFQAVHQESIVVPENIDAILAITETVTDPGEAIRSTDDLMGLGRLW